MVLRRPELGLVALSAILIDRGSLLRPGRRQPDLPSVRLRLLRRRFGHPRHQGLRCPNPHGLHVDRTHRRQMGPAAAPHRICRGLQLHRRGSDRTRFQVPNLAATPGVEFLVPVGQGWILKPFAEIGYGRDFDNDLGFGVWSVGMRTIATWPVKKWDLSFGTKVQYLSSFTSDLAVADDFGEIRLGFDARHPLPFTIGSSQGDLSRLLHPSPVRRCFHRPRRPRPARDPIHQRNRLHLRHHSKGQAVVCQAAADRARLPLGPERQRCSAELRFSVLTRRPAPTVSNCACGLPAYHLWNRYDAIAIGIGPSKNEECRHRIRWRGATSDRADSDSPIKSIGIGIGIRVRRYRAVGSSSSDI